jgi:microcystin-dependent protein
MVVGSIIISPVSTIPEGFLVCDGSAVSRDQYADLFDVIGTTYGAGDGSTTFNLPNLSGRTVIGGSNNYAVGSSGGTESVTLIEDNLPTHEHTIPSHGHANDIAVKTPQLAHSITQAVFKYTSLTTNVTNRYGSSYPKSAYTNRTSAGMSRSTNLAVSAHEATACTMSGGIIDCAAFDTESTGMGNAHNNMMPYLTLTYLIYAPETVYPPGMAFYNNAMVLTAGGAYISGKTRVS